MTNYEPRDEPAKANDIFKPYQMSARLLMKYAQSVRDAETDPEKWRKSEQRFVLLYDLYIKARSYGLLSKTFFWLSLAFSIAVLLWPSLEVVFKDRLQDMEWVKSAVVQTTVTGIAALNYAFYTQYKNKQTYAENLMRHTLFSNEDISVLSAKLADEIAKIDKGFSFSSIAPKEE
jgi:hypothetical protein